MRARKIAIIVTIGSRSITDRIYLDHAATTPLRPEAKAAMEEGFRIWANPSSPHAEGRKARAALEDARERVKAALGWDGEVIFTSGASEAAALAYEHSNSAGETVSAVEHDCLIELANSSGDPLLKVHPNGSIDLSQLDNDSPLGLDETGVVHAGGVLAAIQHVNSETGNCQEFSTAAELIKFLGGNLLVDCAQSAGKFALPLCNMAIISAHKFGGPVGIGALLVKDFNVIRPQGGQERGYRRGTENLPSILGMAAALEACSSPYVDPSALEPLNQLADEVRAAGGTWLSDRLANPTPFIRAMAMPIIGASAQVMRFDMAGISVSQGSACSSGAMKVSRVLEAMQVEPEIAANTIRVSIGWTTTRAEVERFCDVWLDMARSG